ncbi:ATP-binding cassette domain-containing protein [Pseudoduganella eburnea]|uniref:Cyclolysin secretion/processing ATP-binding protein CyaB n=1 Tax=Massilia eburnea TaxID=1776165 RepID=A0A6L6QIR5_9BURK|nr:peptidase domain-containing ABC transporter [Massilia eburnea]MTW12358.1 ATP-binding cassette domain-containing protein [Massilia eburnea]
MKTILQSEASECGLACLAMVACHFGYQTDLAELRHKFSISLKGATLAQLMRHASNLHFTARPLRLELDELSQLQLPAILHWNLNHFVVLSKVERDLWGKTTVTILDPAVGKRRVSVQEVSRYFTGVALELTPTPQFHTKEETRKVSIGELTGKVIGLRWAIAKVIMLAIALEVFAVAAPLFNQFVIDEVVVSGDRELLKVLVIGFALMLITQNAIGLARSWTLMRWGIDIAVQWSTRVFAHLTRLPASYFEKRHLGDVISRFGSMGAIQSTLTNLFVESMLDGFMALLAFGMMLTYSPKLTCIVLAGLAAYIILRLLAYQPLREASRERLILAAKENSHFLETVRAIVPLKLFGREAERRSRWLNLKQDVINRDIKTQKLGVLFKIGNTAISGVQGLILFYVGANLVMENTLTVGMLAAFTSYSGTFSGRVFSLVDLFFNVRMLSMHAERLSDIVMEPAEPDDPIETDLERIVPSITLRGVRFRYAEGEAWVLDGVDLHIPAGQSIALVGPSGCGKSTLCKLILGLVQPTEGEILVGGVPIRQLGLRAYRSLVGTVMQDDVLLAGSVLDNISFFDSGARAEKAQECARLAAIHDEIAAMPMGYQTLVGDMGSSLSGGQKQRLLLARALYKTPRILALDEATSHLDVNNEAKVNAALAELKLTRIMVAHRPETINAAQRVVAVQDGKVFDLGEDLAAAA